MHSASHFDVMRVDALIDAALYAQGIALLERIVAMLTELIEPCCTRRVSRCSNESWRC